MREYLSMTPVGKLVPQTSAASRSERAKGRPVPVDIPANAPPADEGRSAESVRYQHAVNQLRARGCRCVLRWNGIDAIPHTPGDAATCAIHKDKD